MYMGKGGMFMLRSSTKAKVFVHLFQKVVVSRGEAFGRLPQKANHPKNK